MRHRFFLPLPLFFSHGKENENVCAADAETRALSLTFILPFFFQSAEMASVGNVLLRTRVPPACVGKYATKRIYERVNSSPCLYIR